MRTEKSRCKEMNGLRILGLDTSGKVASCAILDTEAGILLGERSVYTTRTHSQTMLPMCISLLGECGMTEADVDCYAVSVGPGSYTGIRIGLAAVQGMAMVRDVPCIGVSTLEAMASRIFPARHILSVMHARSDLFYSAWFSYQIYMDYDPRHLERQTPDELHTASEIMEMIGRIGEGIVLTGDGAEELLRLYRESHESAALLRPVPPMLRLQSAAGVCQCAAQFADTHTELPHAADLTASYLQAVNISRRKSER